MSAEDPSLLLDALSTRVLRNLTPVAWRKLFLRPHGEVIRFAAGAPRCCAPPCSRPPGPTAPASRQAGVQRPARNGEPDACPPATVLVRFEDPFAARWTWRWRCSNWRARRFQIGLAAEQC